MRGLFLLLLLCFVSLSCASRFACDEQAISIFGADQIGTIYTGFSNSYRYYHLNDGRVAACHLGFGGLYLRVLKSEGFMKGVIDE